MDKPLIYIYAKTINKKNLKFSLKIVEIFHKINKYFIIFLEDLHGKRLQFIKK